VFPKHPPSPSFNFVIDRINRQLKQQHYISSFMLILFFSIVFLNDYSISLTGNHSVKQYMDLQINPIEKWSQEDGSDVNVLEPSAPVPKVLSCDRTLIHKEITLFALYLYKSQSNLSHIDLPPPAQHI